MIDISGYSWSSVPGIGDSPAPFTLPRLLKDHVLPHRRPLMIAKSHIRTGLLFRQRREPQVRPDYVHLREELLGLWALDARVHDHVVARHPVDWGGHAVLVAGLQAVESPIPGTEDQL